MLAGGTGSRLWPVTLGVSKQLLPVYDKPLVHYPISTLMLAGVRDILIITTPEDQNQFRKLLGSGDQFGVRFEYLTQASPRGLAEAFIIAEGFIKGDECALILGDNIFYGEGLGRKLQLIRKINGAHIFAYKVKNPENYGVIELDDERNPIGIIEKPGSFVSNLAVPGLYFYDNSVIEIAKNVRPSNRGELEITSINQIYLSNGKLTVSILDRGTAWLDTGTFEDLHAASSFIQVVEQRQGYKIACLEEIAWYNKWISSTQLLESIKKYGQAPYANYLNDLLA